LLRNILSKPLIERPEIGTSPFDGDVDAIPKATHDPVKDMMKFIISYYENTANSAIDIPRLHSSDFASSRTMADLIINQAVERGYIDLDLMNGCVWLQDKGKQYAMESDLI